MSFRLTTILCSAAAVLVACAQTADPDPISIAQIRLQGQINKDLALRKYEEDWRLKVERVGAELRPRMALDGPPGSLRLTVSIKSDGSVDSIRVDRSSGQIAFDEAATNIVHLASPFPAFPPEMARYIDMLVITRTWHFGPASQGGDKVTRE